MTRRSLPLLVLLCVLPGCALTSKGEALSPRYFNPQAQAPSAAPAAGQPFELKLGQVSSASNLDERIAYRLSSAEVGFYEDRRWTELPEAYLRRALERDLFEQRGLARVVSGVAPVLDIELTAFEEVREKPTKVRVSLTFSLRDERRSLLERSLTLEQPTDARAGDEPQAVAQALANALGQAVQAVGNEVARSLARAARPEPSPSEPPRSFDQDAQRNEPPR